MSSRSRIRFAAASASLVALLAVAPAYGQHASHVAQAAVPASTAAAAPTPIKSAEADAVLRDLWVGHAFWVRNVALQTFAGNKAATSAAEEQVVVNAKQIAASIEPYYGKAASDKLLNLLVGHYGAVKQYLEATVAGSQAKQDAAVRNLTDNAGEIAVFLSSANPNLPRAAVQNLLVAHGAHHIQQIRQLQAKQYAQEAQTWEAMKSHMYVIADALAGAIAKQFPAKFG